MKLKYTDEQTFESEIVEFPDEQVELAEKIRELFSNTPTYPLIVRSDKRSLCIPVNLGKTREDKEIGTNLYRVTIEKI